LFAYDIETDILIVSTADARWEEARKDQENVNHVMRQQRHTLPKSKVNAGHADHMLTGEQKPRFEELLFRALCGCGLSAQIRVEYNA
jgi:hypothetical protein